MRRLTFSGVLAFTCLAMLAACSEPGTASGFDGVTTDSPTLDGSVADNTVGPDTPTGDTPTADVPPPVGCGDGTIGAGEQCDDGNTAAGDGCDAQCVLEQGWTCTGQPSTCTAPTCDATNICGDGNICGTETCDNGPANADNADCLTSCQLNVCGDGFQNANGPNNAEGCDDGNGVLIDDCPDGPAGTCQPATCGDGFTNSVGTIFANEVCDDGNQVDTDGCTNQCTLQASCGDSADPDPQVDLNNSEPCDSGTAFNSDSLPGDCTTVCRTDCTCPTCGDGVTDYPLGEECDDFNSNDGDGCSANCTIEVDPGSCGNGTLEAANSEQCDDNNNTDGDGCSSTCQFEPLGASCGDGTVDPSEVCDDNNLANGDTCNTTCNFENITDAFVLTGNGGVTVSADNTWLWTANELTGEVARTDIDACITKHATTGTPCTDATGGNPGCQDPCATQVVVTMTSPTTPSNNMHAFYSTSDGQTVWWGASGGPNCSPSTESYIYAMHIPSCDSALLGGATDCTSLAQVVAGGTIGHVDGFGTNAQLQGLRGLTYMGGFLYFLDGGCGTIRRFDPITTEVTTIVGDPSCPANQVFQEGFGGILPSSGGASLLSPRYMDTDHSGFLYISDNFDHTISRYNVVTNYLERWVGNASAGAGYADNANGAQAQFDRPRDIASDGTSVFVADFDNYTIRQVDIQTGAVSTMVGIPAPGANPSGKCDYRFGQGTQGAGAPQFTKPLEMAYHFPSGSLFFYTGGTGGAGCFGGPPCTGAQVQNAVWRIR